MLFDYISNRIESDAIKGRAEVRHGDARNLEDIDTDSINIIVTSPPYLNAIDYLRGHRLALVWLGYDLGLLRQIRSSAVGVERVSAGDSKAMDVAPLHT